MGPGRDHFGTIFETIFETIVGPCLDHFWDHCGAIFGPYWGHFGAILPLTLRTRGSLSSPSDAQDGHHDDDHLVDEDDEPFDEGMMDDEFGEDEGDELPGEAPPWAGRSGGRPLDGARAGPQRSAGALS